jgi:sugar/nucleoside kinase (ribokinase family)
VQHAPFCEAVVYGTVCLDRFVFVGPDGEPADDASVQEMPGGEAFNTAAALAGWGVRVLLTGTAVGSDAESDRLRHLLATSPLADGIDLRLLPTDPVAVTPVCTVRVFPDGERRMNGRGFAQAVAPPPLPAAVLASRPLFVTDPNLGATAVTQTLAAYEAGCPILAMDFAAVPEVVRVSRVLVTSREMLARQGIAPDDPESVAVHLVEAGARTAIVTLGPAGCVVAERDEGVFHQPAFAVPGILDTTGAGDVFRGGLAYSLLHGLPLRDTVRFASAAAALHCTVLGGGSRLPLEQVLTLAAA